MMLKNSMFALLVTLSWGIAWSDGPYLATGIKIGEVTPTEAIVWTRLTQFAQRSARPAVPIVRYRDPDTGQLNEWTKQRPDGPPVVEYPAGTTIDTIEGAAPGAPGEVRVRYKSEDDVTWLDTPWMAVEPERDFTRQFKLSGLTPNTRYEIKVEAKTAGRQPGQVMDGRFQTAPRPEEPARVVFLVSTGQQYEDLDLPGKGYRMYAGILRFDPQFFVHTGDIVYYDRLAKDIGLARWHWNRMYSLPTNVEFHRQVASYFIKDDHDTWKNDCWPDEQTRFMGEFTFKQGQAVFLEQVPMGDFTYRTYRWGKDLQIWLVEGRDFRSPNTMPDGPDKSIWGPEQKQWFVRTVQESDATFRVLISPTPLVGPDRSSKADNHANECFAHEGRELRRFISGQKNLIVMCGDRHWQYVSVDEETGLREYSCGPASDRHAGGWKQSDVMPEHRFLRVAGGFLSATVDRVDGKPVMMLRHHDVDGKVVNEDRIES